ncbi:MAG: endonuclease/exonuclease/phosphatase family protein [Myxococcota bacterium]
MARLLSLAALWTFALPAQADSIRVVSWNVWGVPIVSPSIDARMAAVVPALQELDPDVVALQEVWQEEHGDFLTERLREAGYPHVQHIRGEGREGGLLVASRWPMEELEYLPYSMGQVGIVPWHVDFMANKGAVQMRIRAPGGDFTFVNTHLQASYGGRYTAVRLSQSLQLANAVDRLAGPLILAGDVNSRQWELPFRTLRARAGLEDAFPGFGIDAVLHRGGFRVVDRREALAEERILPNGERRRISDHRALYVELERVAAAAVSPLDWNRVRREARRFAAATQSTWETTGWGARMLGLLLASGLFILLRKRAKRSPRLRRRRRRMAVALSFVALLLLYIGFVYGPASSQGMGDTLRSLSQDSGPVASREDARF